MTSPQASGGTDDQVSPHSLETCACLGPVDSPVGFEDRGALIPQRSLKRG